MYTRKLENETKKNENFENQMKILLILNDSIYFIYILI